MESQGEVRTRWPLSVLGAPGWLALGWVLGTALQLQQDQLWSLPAYGVPVVAALLFAGGRYRSWPGGVLVALAGALAFGAAGWRSLERSADRLDPALWGQEVQLVGVVASLPVRGPQGMRLVLAVESAQMRGEPVRVPRRVALSLWQPAHGAASLDPERLPAVTAGDRWQMSVRLRPVHGLSNPHGSDRELHAWSEAIGAQGSLRPGARWLEATGEYPLERWRQSLSDRLQDRLAPGSHGGVLAALAVGDQDAIAEADWTLFRRTGVAHLMAISGLHITLFAWLAVAVIQRWWRWAGRLWPALLLQAPASRVAAVGGWGAATAYALAAGWGVPAQRTVLMLALALWLRQRARRWPGPVQWLVVLAAVLCLEPWAWLQAGFWLSFVAVGVLMASEGGSAREVGGRWRVVLRLLREQLTITLALAPLSLWLFGETSLVGLLANLVAIPWVSFVVTPLTLMGGLIPALWDGAAMAMDPLHALLQWLSASDMAVWSCPAWPLPWALAAMAGGGLAVWPGPPLWRCAGVLMLAWAFTWSPDRPPPGQFRLLALDVGQGSAVLVQTRTHALLHDTGPAWGAAGDAGARVVVPTLRALGVAPDRVMVSHRDTDHAGGSAAVRAAWPLAQWSSSEPALAPQRCQRGQVWQWDGVRFEVLSPLAEDYGDDGRGRWPANAMSCVLRVQAADGTAAVLTGDVDAPRETRMALSEPQPRVDLLMVPHHGSRSSSSPVLLNAWRPSVAIVQAGFMNRFGHPAPEVVERYRERSVHLVDTPSCGAVSWRSQVPGEVGCERLQRPRHWQVPVSPAAQRQGSASPS